MPTFQTTPLCPAGHLPLKGGDRSPVAISPVFNGAEGPRWIKCLISPLEGEMSGRTEGGRLKRLSAQTNPQDACP
ncbi:lytic murein transglycosylase [Salmonella enterica subsp. enterica]|nr:lytic murein transglycosylase [Salmonella enterica subsp. enterica serovar Paratyphi A]